MRVTIKEIAERAGVHRATVDKVLHNRDGVSDEVRQQIQQLIDELGYRPNPAGQTLQKQSKTYRFAAILCDVDAMPYHRQGIEQGIRDHENFNIEVLYQFTGFQNVREQSELIYRAIESQVDGIILNPINSPMIRTAIDKAAEKGIPVITVDSDIPDSNRLCYVGLDGVRASRVAGRLMGQFVGGEGEIAIISSAITTENNSYFVAMREQGFRKFITEIYPNIRIVECVESFEDPQITYQKTKELLERFPHLNGIYVTCGGVAEVGRALEESGRSRAIRVICFEEYPQILDLVRRDVVDVTLASGLIRQGRYPVELLMQKLVFDKEPPEKQMFTELRILVRESID